MKSNFFIEISYKLRFRHIAYNVYMLTKYIIIYLFALTVVNIIKEK